MDDDIEAGEQAAAGGIPQTGNPHDIEKEPERHEKWLVGHRKFAATSDDNELNQKD